MVLAAIRTKDVNAATGSTLCFAEWTKMGRLF